MTTPEYQEFPASPRPVSQSVLWVSFCCAGLGLFLFLWLYPWQPKTRLPSPLPGFVIFRISPPHAQLRIQGKPHPHPIKGLALPHGSYLVQAEAKGYHSHQETIRVEGDDAILIRIRLRPHKVNVRIESSPSAASLFFNDRRVGQTPYSGFWIPGPYKIRLEKPGFVAVTQTILLRPVVSPQRFVTRLGGDAQWHSPGQAWIHWIPPTSFLRGSHPQEIQVAQKLCLLSMKQPCPLVWFSSEIPQRLISLPGFWIERTETTYRQYQRCVQAGVCQKPKNPGLPDRPVVGVTWLHATTYCRWAGGRLPTEAEWELAARGLSPQLFPWGNVWHNQASNHGTFSAPHKSSRPDPSDGFTHSAPVGQFLTGRSPYRLLDMAGNVAEWTADCFHTSYYRQAPAHRPLYQPPGCISHTIRGGSWLSPPWEIRTTSRIPMPSDATSPTVGFRCVYPPTAVKPPSGSSPQRRNTRPHPIRAKAP